MMQIRVKIAFLDACPDGSDSHPAPRVQLGSTFAQHL
jgi:hypothetical protein